MAVFVPDKLQHSQSIEQFLKEIEDDFGAPGNSKFQDYIPKSRKNLHAMEEVGLIGVRPSRVTDVRLTFHYNRQRERVCVCVCERESV